MMKKLQEIRKIKVKMLRGAVLDEGKIVKAGSEHTVRQNLARILIASGRAEEVTEKQK